MLLKKVLSVLLAAAVLILLLSCSESDEKKESYYSFLDYSKNEIVLLKKPEKVAVLFSSLADMWSLAGGEIYATVGESVERGFAEKGVLLADGGAGKTIDTELLMSYEPDFVICSADIEAQVSAAGLLNEAGIPAAVFKIDSFDDYFNALKIMTDITGDKEAFDKHAADIKLRIDKIKKEAKDNLEKYGKKDILFIRAGSKYSSTKAKTKDENFVCAMLSELGVYNIAEAAPVLLDGLSTEEIVDKNPDFIFISTMGDEEAAKSYMEEVFKDDVWQSLDAVKKGNYTYLEKELFQYKPNAKWDLAYEKLFDLIWN